MTAAPDGAAQPATPSQADDAAHAARSGVSQILAMLGQGLMPLHRVLVARLFGQTAYGVYRTGADLCEVLMRAGIAGADKAMLKFVAAHRAVGETREEEQALGSALRLSGGLLLVLSIALAVAAPYFARLWGNPAFTRVLPLLAPTVFGGGMVIVLMAATLAVKVTRVNLLVRGVAEPFLLIAITLVFWFFRRDVLAAAAAHGTSTLVLMTLAWVGASAALGRGRLRAALRAPGHRGLIRFAIPLGASEFMNGILQRASVFILSAYAGAASVAVYAAAEELGRSVAGMRYAFDSVAAPMMSEAIARGDRERLRYNLALMTRWVASASAPIALTLLALRGPLLWLYGPAYVSGVTAMGLLVCGHLINGVLGLCAYVIVMSGRSGLFFWDNLSAAAVNLVLSFLLIPRYGVTGAAVASLISVACMLGAIVLQVWHYERVHPFNFALAKPFLAAACAFVGELAVRAIPVAPKLRVALVVVAGLVIYPAALLALRPGEEERRFVVGLVRRVLGRGRAA
ncbi:MAG TPA: polysaccharide biosynthesis C-terminal domain-containing protein [Polyangia bacterium]|nr:polysaccharide biosynthesis C-terminal domain-containing protein [Polyangia bacterium]